MDTVLVLVHPGSACGSADFNLGRFDARAGRDGLASELRNWRGPLIVIDGDLSDELVDYPALSAAIEGALERARAAGLLALREYGEDSDETLNQQSAIEEIITRQGWRGSGKEFVVTGAWYHAEDEGGCVGSVIEAIREAGCVASVSEFALELPVGDEEDGVYAGDDDADQDDEDLDN